MPYRRGPNGRKVPLSPEELDAIYKKYENGARKVVSQRVTDEENLQAEVAVANRAWEERLGFLAQKRELLKKGEGTEGVSIEIDVRNTVIFNAFQDLNVFSKWIEAISQDEAQVIRAYGFAVRLAERLGVARRATQNEKETILNDLEAGRKPGRQFVIYRGEFKLPASPENELHKRVFYRLEGLRRAVKTARENQAEPPSPSESEREESED